MATRTKYPRVHVVIQWAEFGPLDDLKGRPITVEQFDQLARAAAADAPEGGGYNKIKMNVYVDGEDTLEMRHDADRRTSEGRGLRQMMVNRLAVNQGELDKVTSGQEPEQRHHAWARQAVPVYRSVVEALAPTERSADRAPRPKAKTPAKKKASRKKAPKNPSRQWWPHEATEQESRRQLVAITMQGYPNDHDLAELLFESGLVDRDLERSIKPWWLTTKGAKTLSASQAGNTGSLNALLAELGYHTRPGDHPGTKDVLDSTGTVRLTSSTAAEVTGWLRDTGQLPTNGKRQTAGSATGRYFTGADPKKKAIPKKKAAKFKKGQRVSFDIPATAFRLPRFGHGSVVSTNPMSGLLDVDVDGGLVTVISPEHVKKSRKKKPAAKKKATTKKASKKVSKTTAKKTPAKKRARPKGDDEIRLLKRSGKLIATYGVSYKLTQAMESIRDCARRGKPCKLSTVIKAYDQLRNAARSPGKSPRQGLAYYIAAELAKDLRRSDELEGIGKGDHPRIKEA